MTTKPPIVGVSRLPPKSTQPPRVLSCDVKEQLSVLLLGCQVFWAELTRILHGQALLDVLTRARAAVELAIPHGSLIQQSKSVAELVKALLSCCGT